jgi:hypothetical protein
LNRNSRSPAGKTAGKAQKKVPLTPISLEPSLNVPTYEFYSPKNTIIGRVDQLSKRKARKHICKANI